MHMLMTAASQELCLGHIQLQAVCTHALSYTSSTLLTETRILIWTTETIHLCVVSIKVNK